MQGKVYRCLKASAVAYLTKIEMLESVKRIGKSAKDDTAMTRDQKAAFVREYQENVTRLFDPQTQILTERFQQDNYGLNCNTNADSNEESKVH